MKKKELVVVYIITKLELGGAQKICLSLFNDVQKKGYKNFLITGDEGPLVNQLKNNNNVFLLKALKREVKASAIQLELTAFWQIIRILQKLKKKHPNLIVHTHSTKAGLIGRWAAFFAGIKKRITTIHGFGFHPFQRPLGWYINFILEWLTSFITTHYICVSSKDLHTGIMYFPNFRKKSSLIRAAVPIGKFKAATSTHMPSTNTFRLGTVSCFKKQKNLIDMIKAFHGAWKKNPYLSLDIIGDGEQRNFLQKTINAYGIKNRVTLHGWQTDVTTVMRTWHVFILSSLWEGLPCAIVEARALNLPVIAYDTGGISDIIFHKHNGLLCSPKSIPQLQHAIYTISTHSQLYKKLCTYPDNLTNFDHTTMIKYHIALYKKLSTPSKGAS